VLNLPIGTLMWQGIKYQDSAGRDLIEPEKADYLLN
jgi:hypothetical protein